MESLEFSTYNIMLTSDGFTSSFPIWTTFISYSCLIALAKTFNTMLNKSDEGKFLFCSWS